MDPVTDAVNTPPTDTQGDETVRAAVVDRHTYIDGTGEPRDRRCCAGIEPCEEARARALAVGALVKHQIAGAAEDNEPLSCVCGEQPPPDPEDGMPRVVVDDEVHRWFAEHQAAVLAAAEPAAEQAHAAAPTDAEAALARVRAADENSLAWALAATLHAFDTMENEFVYVRDEIRNEYFERALAAICQGWTNPHVASALTEGDQ